jgi:ubiquinone/menaquinone biosynthesis C-methylase UbiE
LRLNRSLEIGCGAGAFSRLLAKRSESVLALDLSPRMIEIAKERSKDFSNVEYRVADAATREFPSEEFDCIASIATLHHLPMEMMLAKMRDALKAGGTLIVLDLVRAEGISDALANVVALPVNGALRLARTGRLRPPRQLREAWAEHYRTDSYLTISEARKICADLLPGARVRKHLLWRYSVVWNKPAKT